MTSESETDEGAEPPEEVLEREASALAAQHMHSENGETLFVLHKQFVSEYKALRGHFEILLLAARALHHGEIQMQIAKRNLPQVITCFIEHLNTSGFCAKLKMKKKTPRLSQSDRHSNPHSQRHKHALEESASFTSAADLIPLHSNDNFTYVITRRF